MVMVNVLRETGPMYHISSMALGRHCFFQLMFRLSDAKCFAVEYVKWNLMGLVVSIAQADAKISLYAVLFIMQISYLDMFALFCCPLADLFT